ncbi:MAG: UDP-N-acetylmuramoyl-tripeptide--D-alanyl-D-alanine ligase [Lachnospiraceae bacterium]
MSVELKIKNLTAEEIAKVCRAELIKIGSPASEIVERISHDSREGGDKTLFCAIVGEKYDGHDFIADAVSAGSQVVLLSSLPENTDGLDFYAIRVEDTVKALGTLAAYYKDFSDATFVAVTGSVGKTTTKEFISAVASASFKTHKTKGNYNNEIGLPLTLFDLSPDDKVSVIEMGMSARGEIEYMSKLVRPDIAVITNIGTSHLAALGTRENICAAKLEIVSGLKKDGSLMLNADEPLLFATRGHVEPEPEFVSVQPLRRLPRVNIAILKTGLCTISFTTTKQSPMSRFPRSADITYTIRLSHMRSASSSA